MTLLRRSYAARMGDNRVLSAPFELAVSLLFITTSLSMVQTLVDLPAAYPHLGLLALPAWLLWAWCASIGIGGLLILLGLVVGPYLRIGRGIEKAGLWLAATSWFSVFLADAWTDFHRPFSWLTYLTVVLGCVLRLAALRRIERAVQVVTDTDAPENGLDSDR